MPDEPLTITAAAARTRTGDLTPSELLEQCLRRIDVYEPAVQAWVYLDRERARRDAEQLTAEVKAGQYRGPLHGIPVGVKDIIDVFDMPTGCGSKLWANSYARRDATVVERLRAAGALILGKTVTTPFAFTDPPKTRNPWDLTRTPGGSSSGSAAAVACGMCLGALGTQTGGSLTRPASYCGVHSLKPTYGRVSVKGVLPLAWSLDHVGVMANGVRDLAILFEATAGNDHRNAEEDESNVPDCLRHVDATIDGTRWYELQFDFLGGMFRELVCTEVAKPYEELRQRIKDRQNDDNIALGSSAPVSPFGGVLHWHKQIMAVEAAAYHAERLRRHPDDYPPKVTELIETGLHVPACEYSIALDQQHRFLKDHNGGDPYPWVTPATLDLPPDQATTGDPKFNAPWSFLGWPTISVPIAASEGGLPIAAQFVGRSGTEKPLFDHAVYVEKLLSLPRRLPPAPISHDA